MAPQRSNFLTVQTVFNLEHPMFDNIFSTLGQVGTLTLFGGVFVGALGILVVEVLMLVAGKPQVRRLASKSV